MDHPPPDVDPPVPAWVRWTNRAVLTVAGTTAAVAVTDYARASGEALDVALVAAVVAATVVGVLRPDHMVAVMLASLLCMLGLALVPPTWLLALVPPLLLLTVRNRRRARELGLRRPRGRSRRRTAPPDEHTRPPDDPEHP